MLARLTRVLFTGDEATAQPPAPARAPRSPLLASAGQATKHAPDALPVHSFGSLPADLAAICLSIIAPADPALPGFRLVTTPPIQRQGLDLLGVSHRLGVAP
jgi:hypothetical protein